MRKSSKKKKQAWSPPSKYSTKQQNFSVRITGSENCMNLMALWQPEKDLPLRPLAAEL